MLLLQLQLHVCHDFSAEATVTEEHAVQRGGSGTVAVVSGS